MTATRREMRAAVRSASSNSVGNWGARTERAAAPAGPGAHPRAGVKPNPRFFAHADLGSNDGTVGHIGIIACIFFNGRHCNTFGLASLNQSKRRALTLGQDNFHRIWEMSREQSLIGCTRRRRGTGPSCPAFAKLPDVLVR